MTERELREWEDLLAAYRRAVESRDDLVAGAYRAGLAVRQIHLRSGISRQTIYRILARKGAGARDEDTSSPL
ncbi:MAG: helix-turn-helix domain-containing protein [Bacillota bacterium]